MLFTYNLIVNVYLQGWSVFSKVANVAKENAMKYGSLASQKVVEVSGTVTDKVDHLFWFRNACFSLHCLIFIFDSDI